MNRLAHYYDYNFNIEMDYLLAYFGSLSPGEIILAALLLLFFLIQLYFYLVVYRRPLLYEKKREKIGSKEENSPEDYPLPGISVIIVTKDNAKELEKNLPAIMEQEYPEFEVVVVNSGSSDDSDVVLNAAGQEYPRLYHTFLPVGTDGVNEKKLALTLGVKAAKYDCLLFTEPYCKPSSSMWIREYGKEFASGKDIILGYSKIIVPKNARKRRYIRLDNMIHQLKFLSMALVGKPFMGIGRNMAYKKELFYKNKGFSALLGIDGGEDDLFINRIAPGNNTGIVASKESMTEAHSVKSLSTWKALRSKYQHTKQYYKGFAARIFGLESFSKYSFYLLLVISFSFGLFTSNLLFLGLTLFLFVALILARALVVNRCDQYFNS